MYKNQNKVFKGYLFMYAGLLLCFGMMLFIPIYSNVLKNPFGDFPIFMAIFIIILSIFIIFMSSRYNIMLLIDYKGFISPGLLVGNGGWFIQGVPNNKKEDFKVHYSDLLNEEQIVFLERKKGVFECDSLNIKFDMTKWLRKKYYIYEYLLTILQCKFASEKIYNAALIKPGKNICIVFKCNLKKDYQKNLIKNGHTNISFLYKLRMRKKYGILNTYSKKKKVTINDFYHFN